MQLQIKSIVSSLVGNILEWYEYTLYAYFATVISQLFFPSHEPAVAMMMTFATFAVGLAARPLGGIIFGYIGDRYSRKEMLTITMLLMSIPTLCIGMLPTYSQIGLWAPVLLISLRVLQGVALGGEFGASCVYLYESGSKERRGFWGTLPLTGVGTGLVLSACTIFIIESAFSADEIMAYAWRIPFFISVAGALLGLYMRRSLVETSDFVEAKERKQLIRNPFKTLMTEHKTTMLKLFSIFLTTQVSFFVVFIFGKSLMIQYLGYDSHKAGLYNLCTVLSYTLSTLVWGMLADKVDRRTLIFIGTAGIFATVYPFVGAMQAGDGSATLILSLTLGALIGMTEGTLNPVVASSFPTKIRATSVAFCWNFTSVAFGGVAPMLAMTLIEKTGNVSSVAFMMMGVCAVTLASLFFMLLQSRGIVPSSRLQH